jgi:hypothetical protein
MSVGRVSATAIGGWVINRPKGVCVCVCVCVCVYGRMGWKGKCKVDRMIWVAHLGHAPSWVVVAPGRQSPSGLKAAKWVRLLTHLAAVDAKGRSAAI